MLVRDGRIAAVWDGPIPPAGVDLDSVVHPVLDPNVLIYPGLINLHDHPLNDALPLWQTPSSHVQAAVGRSTGTEPYANRYQWSVNSPPELGRLVASPRTALTDPLGLNLAAEVVKYGEARMILGGTTATQGAPANAAYDTLLARNVDSPNFGRDRIDNFVPAIASLTGTALSTVVSRMQAGLLDAWIVHLAEGVRDADRRPGDVVSSRQEFADLKSKGLLTDSTVIIHGVGLESPDFAEMAAAPSAHTDGTGDGRGAKLVWSPLSNLLLYGQTASVYEALAAGVLATLGTDWSPSGSPNLLTELKVADLALRDERLLGSRRWLVPALSTDGRTEAERREAELALDRLLVEMVTINAARAIRWDDRVGSIEAGKPGVPKGTQTLAQISSVITDGLRAMGGDRPPPGGGPSPLTNSWSYLRLHSLVGAGLTDTQFLFGVLIPVFGLVDGRLNIEAMSPAPLFMADDDWRLATLGAKRDPTSGLVSDETPPYSRYSANVNHVTALGNPFASSDFELRWYKPLGVTRAPDLACDSSQVSRP